MKIPVVVLGVFLCLGAFAQGQANNPNSKSTQQTATRMKRPSEGIGQSVTGCVDEENGHYVLRDIKTDQLIRLQPAGESADNDFARFVGHQAQATGTVSTGTMTVAHIGQVADMCPIGK